MRSAGSLEARLGSDLSPETDAGTPADVNFACRWIEPETPFARPVTVLREPSPVRYFLDGAQQTLPGYHYAAIPIHASLTAAAILERRSPSDLQIMPGMIELDQSWLAPKRSRNAVIDQFIESAERAGFAIVDPLNDLSDEHYAASLRDYTAMERRTLETTRSIRAKLELDLLLAWQSRSGGHSGWIVVDGALRSDVGQAIGVVKSFTRQYVGGEHADQLFRLVAGHRSPALLVEDRWRSGQYAVWYLRLQDATGRDPRHGLIRIEVADPSIAPELIEAISGWVLAERRPRPTADSRWPVLLYPIHYLEQILKRYTAQEIRYWPGARATT